MPLPVFWPRAGALGASAILPPCAQLLWCELYVMKGTHIYIYIHTHTHILFIYYPAHGRLGLRRREGQSVLLALALQQGQLGLHVGALPPRRLEHAVELPPVRVAGLRHVWGAVECRRYGEARVAGHRTCSLAVSSSVLALKRVISALAASCTMYELLWSSSRRRCPAEPLVGPGTMLASGPRLLPMLVVCRRWRAPRALDMRMRARRACSTKRCAQNVSRRGVTVFQLQ